MKCLNNLQSVKSKIRRLLRHFFKFCLYALCAILLAMVLRISFGVFQVSGLSMNPTLLADEYIVVNKMIPGPRFISNVFSLKRGEELQLKRIFRCKAIERNEILIFNKPSFNMLQFSDLTTYHIKRCVAIPGDTFLIENGFNKVKKIDDTLGDYFCQQAISNKINEKFDPVIFNCFPFDSVHKWNVKNFGPIYIPRSGDTLLLDTLTIKLYQNQITYETNKSIVIKDKYILLGDSIITNYVFKKNYYFVVGDWVFNSNDSRYWGLLPEDHVVGKAIMVLYSKDIIMRKHRWERVLKKIE